MTTEFASPAAAATDFDVVAVGAHPDDVEIACGGTLARLVTQGYRVGIIDLTDGEPTPRCPHPDVRRAEAHAAAAALGVNHRAILNLPNRRLFDGFEARVELAKQLRRWRPQIVVGFGQATPLASPDHWQTMLITEAAVFYARLSKWDEQFDGLPVHHVSSLVYYSVLFDPTAPASGRGPFVVDIGDFLEIKMASVRCYQTQFPPEKAHLLDLVEATARSVGGAAGFHAGELFYNTRLLGTRNLVTTVLPPT